MLPEDLNDREKGKRIFIIGSSPQLNELTERQIQLLENEVTIGVNRVQYKIKPKYFISAYPSEILLGLKRSPSSTFIHIRPVNESIFPDKKNIITIKREIFNPSIGLPRYLLSKDPILYTKLNVALASTHLALILGASEIIFIGIEMKNVTPYAQHFYDFDPHILRLLFEDLKEIKDYPYFNIDHSYSTYEFHLERLGRPLTQLNYQTSRKENHLESFQNYFQILKNYGINIIATKKDSITYEAGASYCSLFDLLFQEGNENLYPSISPQKLEEINQIKKEIIAELLHTRLSKADISPEALIAAFTNPYVPVSMEEIELLRENEKIARDNSDLLLADTLDKLIWISIQSQSVEHSQMADTEYQPTPITLSRNNKIDNAEFNNSQPVIIAGMHRSGTSMITHILKQTGLYLGRDEDILGASADNEKGHWENILFLSLNDKILAKLGGGWDFPPSLADGWENGTDLDTFKEDANNLIAQFSKYPYWGWKDPRNSLLIPFWKSLLPNAKIVICVRNPIEVAKSLHKRNYFSRAASLYLWLDYTQKLNKSIQNCDYIITHYDTWFYNPQAELKRITEFIGLPITDEIIHTACSEVSTNLRHDHSTMSHLIDEEIPIEVLDTYWKLCQQAGPIYNDIFTQETLEIDFEKIHQIPNHHTQRLISLENSTDVNSVYDSSASSAKFFDQIQEFKIKELTKQVKSLNNQYQTLLEKQADLEESYKSLESKFTDTENKLRETITQLQEANKSLVFSKELVREFIHLFGILLEQLHNQNQYLLEYKIVKELLTSSQKISNLNYRLPLYYLCINLLQRLGEKESKDKLIKDIKQIGLVNINNKIGESIRNYIYDIDLKEKAYLLAQNNFEQIIQATDILNELENHQEIITPELIDIIRQQAIQANARAEDELSKELFEFADIITNMIERSQQSEPTGNQSTTIENEYLSSLLDALFVNSELENKGKPLSLEPVKPSRIPHLHSEPIDIIICVHNALEDVEKCLLSIINHTTEPYNLIIVDDGSAQPTRDYLVEFTGRVKHSFLLRNENARGYTRAANLGMQNSKSKFLVLLNSDTIVGPDWLDGLYSVMMQDEKIGVVGPLSNTASWQSIPKLTENGDWAMNPLPDGMSVDDMSYLTKKYAPKLELYVPLLNGFCLMIRRDVIDQIGYFNEDVFGDGYGEEDDFNLRAQKAGWKLAIADDVYIYHAQSKSYSTERRHQLAQRAGIKLREIHGDDLLNFSVNIMNPNRVLEGIRARTNVMLEIEQYQQKGKEIFSGKKVLFLLPVSSVGGGANVVIDEARCMRDMGVDAQIFNLKSYKEGFSQAYPHIDIPTVFGDQKDLINIAPSYDAVIATANFSVEWLKPLERYTKPILGYYIQDFEPWMYDTNSFGYNKALKSYTLIKNIKSFTKTNWNQQTIYKYTGIKPTVVGISININLFRPRDIRIFGDKPIKIVAMIRPASKYRNPEFTVELLRRLEKEYNQYVLIQFFGTTDIRYNNSSLPLDFNYEQYGILTQLQVANLLSKADIFVDFSKHQAMGLTALEAMACGCAVIVPQNGGSTEFVQHQKNGLIVDTSTPDACYNALKQLVENDSLRREIQLSALYDVVQYFPEKAAFNILDCLFTENDSPSQKAIKKKHKR